MLSHLDALADCVADAAGRRKRNRTRARIVLATAMVMSRTGYANLRIIDIAQAAGMSAGAFYVYFPDREAAAREVLAGLLARLYNDDREGSARGPLVERLTGLLMRLQANIPLVRALNQAIAIDPTVARQADRAVAAWLSDAPLAPIAEAAAPARQTALDLHWILLAGCTRRCVQRRLSRSEIEQLAGAVSRACLAAEPL